MIRVALADDHELFRNGLRALFEKEPDIDVVAEAGDGNALLTAIAGRQIDVVILDISMPGLRGAPLVAMLLQQQPRAGVVVLTMHEDPYYLRELFKAGACAYVLKKSSSEDLARAVRAVARGEFHVDAALGGLALADVVTPVANHRSRLGMLTPRERDACRLLALGHTNSEVAGLLGISSRTVETHRASIMAKLELRNRAELVRFGLDNGLLD